MKLNTQQRKEIKIRIKKEILSGKSKQDIYSELILEYPDRVGIAEILDDFVTLKSKEKYKGMNTILLICLSIIAFIDLASLNIVAITIDISLLFVVYKFNVKYYSWISVRGFFAVIAGGIILIFNKEIDYSNPIILVTAVVVFLLIIVSFALGLYLSNKLSPDFTIRKEPYVNEAGEKRLQILHEFQD